jgi:heme exporter protein D
MNWGSAEAFFAMGGHAFYVWGSYAVTFVLLAAEVLLLVLRRRSALARLRDDSASSRGAP